MYSIEKNTASIWLAAALTASFIASSAPANAALTVSKDPTSFVNCSGGVCSAAAKKAVLNVTDLKHMLATSNVTLLSGSRAADIDIAAAVTWVSANRLTLNAYRSILIERPISVAGPGGLSLATNNGGVDGTYSFAANGKVTFWSLTSSFIVNGNSYTLIDNIATLSNDIADNPNGYYALAKDYDATPDGAYAYSPILTTFGGTFDGLGNTISNLTVHNISPAENVGFFSILSENGSLVNVRLLKLSIDAKANSNVGGLVAVSSGTLTDDTEAGRIVEHTGQKFKQIYIGGLAGISNGNITDCHTRGTVSAGVAIVGGLVGFSSGIIRGASAGVDVSGGYSVGGLAGMSGFIEDSFATGNVTANGTFVYAVGGLVGENGEAGDSYSTGTVTNLGTSTFANVGGFVGLNSNEDYSIGGTYSTGFVSGGAATNIGGFVGSPTTNSKSINNSYWDKTSSGTTNGGCPSPGCTGLTTKQFKSGLPAGLNNSIWRERHGVNNGLPYLINNPPR